MNVANVLSYPTLLEVELAPRSRLENWLWALPAPGIEFLEYTPYVEWDTYWALIGVQKAIRSRIIERLFDGLTTSKESQWQRFCISVLLSASRALRIVSRSGGRLSTRTLR
jgi:hypothetical protein